MAQKFTKIAFFIYISCFFSSIFPSLEKSTLVHHIQKRLDCLYDAQKFYHHEQALHATIWGKCKHLIDRFFLHSALLPHEVKILSLIEEELDMTAHCLSEILQKEELNDNEKKEIEEFLARPLPYIPTLLKKHRGMIYKFFGIVLLIAAWQKYAETHTEIQSPELILKNIKNCLNTVFAKAKNHSSVHKIVEDLSVSCKKSGEYLSHQANPNIPLPPKNSTFEETAEYTKMIEEKCTNLNNKTDIPNQGYVEKIVLNTPLIKDIQSGISWTYAFSGNLLAVSSMTLHKLIPFIEITEQLFPFIVGGYGYLRFNKFYSKVMKVHKDEALANIQIHLSEAKRKDITEHKRNHHKAFLWHWTEKLQTISSSSFLSNNERTALQPLCHSLKDNSLALSTKILLVKNYCVR